MNVIEQKITLSAADPVTLVRELEQAILNGARIDENFYPRITRIPMMVGLVVEGPDDTDEWTWKSTAYLNCYPIDIAQFKYSKAEIEEMNWEDFRKVCSGVGVKGRDRAKMTKEYLEATGQASTEKDAPTKE